jgi:TPR repeat protein
VRPRSDSRPARESSAASISAVRIAHGEQDFAEAQQYLARNNPRDASVAAQLLWSAIGNGNTQAELVLGGLYLRGRGVQQNCRQAEILLRAALVADVPGASQEIQKLQTYGCR